MADSNGGRFASQEDNLSIPLRLRENARRLRLTYDMVGQVPPEPQPPTLRGRLGGWIISKIRRALFWYTPQIIEFHRNATEAAEEQAAAIMAIQANASELRQDLGQEVVARQTLEGLVQHEMARIQKDLRDLESFAYDLGSKVHALFAQMEQLSMQAEIVRAETAANREAALEPMLRAQMQMEQLQREQIEREQTHRAQMQQEVAGLVSGPLGDVERKVLSLRTSLVSQERRVSVLLEQARKRISEMGTEQVTELVNEAVHRFDALYLTFEDQFRGTREDIKERLRVYLPVLQSGAIGKPVTSIVDIGCGRGEWLEVLKGAGMCARGVDLNRMMVEECHKRHLEAAEGDAVGYLRTLDAESVGCVTGFHVVEHLSFSRLMDLLDETVRVLKPGGVAIFETPNPANILVSTRQFYYDPTHIKPLPHPLLRFLIEERGLCRVSVMELHPFERALRLPQETSPVEIRFNELFYGPQDYAIIGWKI